MALLLVIGAIGAGVMVLIVLPALRIRDLTLVVTTLGLAVISNDSLFRQSWISENPLASTVSPPSLGVGLGRPEFSSSCRANASTGPVMSNLPHRSRGI